MAKTAGVTDEAVKAKTGKTWKEWIRALDKEGCAARDHKGIVGVLKDEYRISPWWQQTVAVGYEQAKGLRQVHQAPDGFQVSVGRKVNAAIDEVFELFNDARKRSRWLPDSGLRRRGATQPRSVRFDVADGSSVVVWLADRDRVATQISLSHTKLKGASEVAARKAYWGEAMKRLRAALEA